MANRAAKRKAATLTSRGIHIRPPGSETPPYEQSPPLFSLSNIQNGYCILDCDKEDKAAFADTLRKLSQLSWIQLKMAGKHKLGYEKIPRYRIKTGIPKTLTEDVTFIAFRFSGMKAMVGYREKNIFHVLWLDRTFTLYNH